MAHLRFGSVKASSIKHCAQPRRFRVSGFGGLGFRVCHALVDSCLMLIGSGICMEVQDLAQPGKKTSILTDQHFPVSSQQRRAMVCMRQHRIWDKGHRCKPCKSQDLRVEASASQVPHGSFPQ